MKKLVVVLFLTAIVSCTSSEKSLEDSTACQRYIPTTKNDFKVVLFVAMADKAQAGYQLGFSELVIYQILKDDFETMFMIDILGSSKNSYLDSGYSCTKALNMAYRNEEYYEQQFHNHILSAMKYGQISMRKTPFLASHVKQLMDLRPVDALKNADMDYTR